MPVDIYVQIDGIKGESTEDQHKDWIEATSFNHNVTQDTSSTRSSAGGATTGASNHGDVSFPKVVDLSSPKLMLAASNGTHFKTATIDFMRQSGANKVKYLTIKLTDLLISAVNRGASSGLVEETVALNYGTIEETYTQQKRTDGSGGGNTTYSYDVMKAKGK